MKLTIIIGKNTLVEAVPISVLELLRLSPLAVKMFCKHEDS